MILKITNLGCGYSSGFSLRGISLNLNSGEVLILKGKNGVGKTTLLRAIIGLIAINAGRITIDGVDVTNKLDVKGEIFSYLGHLNGLKSHLTVSENLKLWFDIFGESNSNVLEEFGINNLINKKVSECSSGQKRMIALARVFNCPKRVLLLDEPMVGLDDTNKKKIQKKIEEHVKLGGSAILVSHRNFPSNKTFSLKSSTIPTSSSLNGEKDLLANFMV